MLDMYPFDVQWLTSGTPLGWLAAKNSRCPDVFIDVHLSSEADVVEEDTRNPNDIPPPIRSLSNLL